MGAPGDGFKLDQSAVRPRLHHTPATAAGFAVRVNEIFGVEGIEDGDYGAKEVSFSVAYWRKANQIHQWFVDHCQEGIDECQEAWVSREQLQELIDICKIVLGDMSRAEELLPTQSGFFFGGTDYDDWYFQDLEQTVRIIEDALELPSSWEFEYRSSW